MMESTAILVENLKARTQKGKTIGNGMAKFDTSPQHDRIRDFIINDFDDIGLK